MNKRGLGVLAILIFLAIVIILIWQGTQIPPGIPTSGIDYWNEHKDEYTTIDGIHYTHPGNDIHNIGEKWKGSYHLIVQGNAGNYAGFLMMGGTITIHGNAKDNVGEYMTEGIITVQGNVEDKAGFLMTGGTITIQGNAGDDIGIFMEGGNIIVQGNASDDVGGGMTGGTITINCEGVPEGEVCTGNKTGDTMNNGTIHIKGNVGDNIGQHMNEGNIIIQGNASSGIGEYMNGGTIMIHGNAGDNVGYFMEGGTITINGRVGNGIGSMQGVTFTVHGKPSVINRRGGTITINCEGVLEGEECTGNNIGYYMYNGTIYIKSKAGPLATGDQAPKGGEIWEYWGTPEERRIYPSS